MKCQLHLACGSAFPASRNVQRRSSIRANRIQKCLAFCQRFIQQQFAILKKQVESDIFHRNIVLYEQIQAFTSQPPLQFRERQRPGVAPGQDFTVDDQFSWQFAYGLDELGKFCDLRERPRKNPHFAAFILVNLCPNSIVLFFYQQRGELQPISFVEQLIGSLNGRRQHESHWMKQAYGCTGQLVLCRQRQCFSDIASQHVCAANFREWTLECFRNGFFDEAFFRSNPQIASSNFHDIFHVGGTGALESIG